MKRLWFKRKNYGWGWYPCCWQGWSVLALFTLVILIGSITISSYVEARPEETTVAVPLFLVLCVALTGALFFVCYRTGEAPRWQWGPKEDAAAGDDTPR